MIKYEQVSGKLLDLDGVVQGMGYSGHGAGVNNPFYQNVPNIGPIPKGIYSLGVFFDDMEKGPMVCHLIPQHGTNTFGRSGFMMHGDNQELNHTASEGCIIQNRITREWVKNSGETEIEVY